MRMMRKVSRSLSEFPLDVVHIECRRCGRVRCAFSCLIESRGGSRIGLALIHAFWAAKEPGVHGQILVC